MSIFSQFDSSMNDNSYTTDYSGDMHYPDIVSHGMVVDHFHDDGYSFADMAAYQDQGNAHSLLSQQDPLAHAHSYHCHHFCLDEDGRPFVHVNGYYRDDGTYVQGHIRTMPDGDITNNLSSRPDGGQGHNKF